MVESQEYITLKRYLPDVTTAVKSDLTSLSGRLLSRNLISPESDAKLRNQSKSEQDRAADLVSLVLDKVKLKKENYGIFIDILRTSGDHFNDLISKLEAQETECVNGSQQIAQQASASASKLPIGALGMMCGCDICTSVLGCPNPLPSEIKFPLFDKCVSSLDDRERKDFQYQLTRDTEEIMAEFYRLASGFCHSIKDSVSVDTLRIHLFEIKAYSNGRSGESIFDEYKEEINRATNIINIFDIITDICSFLDYNLLEHLISILGNKDDKRRMKQYCKEFNKYAKRRICECPCIEPANKAKWSDVYVKLDSRLETDFTINQLQELRYKVSKILRISFSAIRFCCVQRGCIEVRLQFPKFITNMVIPLSCEQEKQLEQLGIKQFFCDNYKTSIKVSAQPKHDADDQDFPPHPTKGPHESPENLNETDQHHQGKGHLSLLTGEAPRRVKHKAGPCELRQFSCAQCDHSWWKTVPVSRMVSRCRECQVRYDALPREKEFGIGRYECTEPTCKRVFFAKCQATNILKCRKCETPVKNPVIHPRWRKSHLPRSQGHTRYRQFSLEPDSMQGKISKPTVKNASRVDSTHGSTMSLSQTSEDEGFDKVCVSLDYDSDEGGVGACRFECDCGNRYTALCEIVDTARCYRCGRSNEPMGWAPPHKIGTETSN